MQQSAKEQTIIRTGFEVVKIVDGDGLIVRNIISKKEEEIRLYGIDAPEIKPENGLDLEVHVAVPDFRASESRIAQNFGLRHPFQWEVNK